MRNNVETEVWYGGVRSETVESAARRYGVTKEVIKRHLDRQDLFRATDPKTKVLMICGALPESAKEREVESEKEVTFWTVIYYILVCPTTGTLPNLMWGAFWMGFIMLIVCGGVGLYGLVLAAAVGIAKIVYCVKWDIDHPRKIVPVEYVPYECGGGDGFFDEVSDRRRSDLQFLLGTGPFAK